MAGWIARSVDDLEITSMLLTVITDQAVGQSGHGKVTNLLAGTAGQVTGRLKAYREAGLTIPKSGGRNCHPGGAGFSSHR